MSEEQLTALLAKLKDDAGLLEKLKSAADLDAAVGIVKEAGFEVSKADWLKHQAKLTLKLSDEELDRVAGGAQGPALVCMFENTRSTVGQVGCEGHIVSINVITERC
jgi:predicted ribosomally synthesized peptide with nif11-like leader